MFDSKKFCLSDQLVVRRQFGLPLVGLIMTCLTAMDAIVSAAFGTQIYRPKTQFISSTVFFCLGQNLISA
jgi:hypothetical protein